MPDLSVDLEALDRFGGTLRGVSAKLEANPGLADSYAPDLGHPLVRDAVHGFEDRWHDGRRHVRDTAESLAAMVTEAVTTFRRADEGLARQLRDAMERQ